MRRKRMHGKRRRRSSWKPSPLKSHHEAVADADYVKRQMELDKGTSVKQGPGYQHLGGGIIRPNPDIRITEDPLWENALELVDPTGVSSYDDAAEAWEGDSNFDKAVETIGIIPGLSVAKGPIKGVKAGYNLIKKQIPKAKNYGTRALQNLGFYDVADDIYEDNIKTDK